MFAVVCNLFGHIAISEEIGVCAFGCVISWIEAYEYTAHNLNCAL